MLEALSGVALIVAAATALAPYWWPPLKQEIDAQRAANRRFRAALPARWANVKSHWRGLRRERQVFGILFILTLSGAVWLLWDTRFGIAPADRSPAFQVLFVVIGAGTFFGGLATFVFGCQIVAWLFEGAFPSPAALPVHAPLNRVGVAAPLGEARFATGQEVASALRGESRGFVPPRFRD